MRSVGLAETLFSVSRLAVQLAIVSAVYGIMCAGRPMMITFE